MFSMKKALWGVVSVFFCMSSVFAEDTFLISRSNSGEYQLAYAHFLPTFKDSEFGWGGKEITSKNYTPVSVDNCSAFPLDSCPNKGICSKCSFDGSKQRLDSCSSGWYKSGDMCCANDCASFGDVNSVPNNKVCTGYDYFPSGCRYFICYTQCRDVSCSGYPIDCSATIANATSRETCPDCISSGSAAVANCSPQKCKITACADGYKVNSNASGCVEKDDTCPTGYYKSCETGTTGDPKYTEKGTACYQCKAATVSNIKVVANFSKDCPSGLSFKFTPSGGNTITCSSSYCYEYDISGYPYACDGMHSNETESIITAGSNVTISNIPSAVTAIKSMTEGKTYNISGDSYTLTSHTIEEAQAAVNSPYDFWTLQCQTCDQNAYYKNMNGTYTVSSGQDAINLYGQNNTTVIPSAVHEVCWAGWTFPSGATISGGPLYINGTMALGIHGGYMQTTATFDNPVRIDGKVYIYASSKAVFNKDITGNYKCYTGGTTTEITCPFTNNCNQTAYYKNIDGAYTVTSGQTSINLYGQYNTTIIPTAGVDVCFAGWTFPSGATISGGPLNINGRLSLGVHGSGMQTEATFNNPVTINGFVLIYKNSSAVFNQGLSGNYKCFDGTTKAEITCPFTIKNSSGLIVDDGGEVDVITSCASDHRSFVCDGKTYCCPTSLGYSSCSEISTGTQKCLIVDSEAEQI